LTLFLLLLPSFVQSNEPLDLVQIDINTASPEDLVEIIHIGEVRALELISLRPFSSLDELTKIKGISESRLQDIKQQGIAWVTESQFKTESEKPVVKEPVPSGIIINEILPSPEGPDAENEWIEIFNSNNFTVPLAGWQIKDLVGNTTIFAFPEGAEILSREFLILFRPSTKITLNNDGDEISVIQPDGKTIDKVSFEKAPRAQSYNLTGAGWLWSTALTPGAANIISAPLSNKETEPPEEVKEISFQKQPEESLSKKELAAISEQIPIPLSFFDILFPALGLACLSGTIILIFKKRMRIDFKNKPK